MTNTDSLPSWFRHPLTKVPRKKLSLGSPGSPGGKSRFIQLSSVHNASKKMIIGGVEVNYLDTLAVSKAFKVSRLIIYKWIDLGIMPEPFHSTTTFSGARSNLWTTSQINAMAVVLNYLYLRGVVNINLKTHAEVLKFIRIGADLALEKLKRKIARAYREKINDKVPDIQWL